MGNIILVTCYPSLALEIFFYENVVTHDTNYGIHELFLRYEIQENMHSNALSLQIALWKKKRKNRWNHGWRGEKTWLCICSQLLTELSNEDSEDFRNFVFDKKIKKIKIKRNLSNSPPIFPDGFTSLNLCWTCNVWCDFIRVNAP